jgi:hypothetical protein
MPCLLAFRVIKTAAIHRITGLVGGKRLVITIGLHCSRLSIVTISSSPSLSQHVMVPNIMTIVHRAAEPDQPSHEAMAPEIGPSGALLTTPPSSTNASARMHSAEEWEAVRHSITRLYMQEKMPLSKVMDMLRHSHDFVATSVLSELSSEYPLPYFRLTDEKLQGEAIQAKISALGSE